MNKLIIILLISFMSCGCSGKMDKDYILVQCKKNKFPLDLIMEEGIGFCRDDIKDAKINLRELDTWSPAAFNKEPELKKLVGIHIRRVSFYSINKEFVGMIMRIDPNLLLYHGKVVNKQITVAGAVYHVGERNDEFAFYSQ